MIHNVVVVVVVSNGDIRKMISFVSKAVPHENQDNPPFDFMALVMGLFDKSRD